MTDKTRAEHNDVVRSLLTKLDRHSPSERDHAERVAVYAVATGETLGLGDGALIHLRYASLLHDVGKISIDAGLLGKLGQLTDEDMEALRLHALIATSILEGFAWLRPCLADIRHHHERWDGAGYPDRLAGPEIPLGARIINLAETFDVISTRPDADEEASLQEIARCSGTQFDPRVVEAFHQVQHLIQPIPLG